DMTSEGGGWTLLGTQVPSSLFWPTTQDIGDVNSGSWDSTWRFGDDKVQAIPVTTAYKLRSLAPSTNAPIDTLFFSNQCVISYRDTWNQEAYVNSMPEACRTAYPTLAMSTPIDNIGD